MPPAMPEFRSLTPEAHPYYGKFLQSADEPLLRATGDATRATFRFLLLPTFSNPEIVRIDRDSDRFTRTAKRLSGQGGYEPGTLESASTVQIELATWEQTNRILEVGGFWSATSLDALREFRLAVKRANCDPRIGGELMDGLTLVVEGANQTTVHTVDRRYPGGDASLHRAWHFLTQPDRD